MITRKNMQRDIVVVLTYLVLDQAEQKAADQVEQDDYKPNRCVFRCRPRTNKEAKDATAMQALPLPEAEIDSSVSSLASVLIEPPIGFADFPLSNAEFQQRFKDKLEDTKAGDDVAAVAGQLGAVIDDRPLSERTIEYFNNPEMLTFAQHAIGEFRRLTLPVEFFRSF